MAEKSFFTGVLDKLFSSKLTRRDFIKGAAIGTAGLVAASCTPNQDNPTQLPPEALDATLVAKGDKLATQQALMPKTPTPSAGELQQGIDEFNQSKIEHKAPELTNELRGYFDWLGISSNEAEVGIGMMHVVDSETLKTYCPSETENVAGCTMKRTNIAYISELKANKKSPAAYHEAVHVLTNPRLIFTSESEVAVRPILENLENIEIYAGPDKNLWVVYTDKESVRRLYPGNNPISELGAYILVDAYWQGKGNPELTEDDMPAVEKFRKMPGYAQIKQRLVDDPEYRQNLIKALRDPDPQVVVNHLAEGAQQDAVTFLGDVVLATTWADHLAVPLHPQADPVLHLQHHYFTDK